MRYARVTAPRNPSHRRIEVRPAQQCARCGALFTPSRTDTKFCSGACRQAAWRAARPRDWAVVWWVRDRKAAEIRARWSYHLTAELAQRAAPPDEPFTVVNIRKPPSITFPSIEEIVRRTRPLCEQPQRDTKIWHGP
jgi:hypothetical protein